MTIYAFMIFGFLLFHHLLISGFCLRWDYNDRGSIGPSTWDHLYPTCSGSSQSPINIEKQNVRFSSHLIAFDLPGYETIPRGAHWEMLNTGNMIQILLNGDYKVKDGGLLGEYKAVRIDFHWGREEQNGSEHVINDTRYPMELQIVHYNLKYGSYDEAVKQPDGLAVFAFLMQVKDCDNPIFMQIVNNLQNVKYRDQQVTLRPVPLLSLLPINLNNYYRYDGSMTSPPCLESVSWTIFSEHIEISSRQMEMFQRAVYSNPASSSSSSSSVSTGGKRQDFPIGNNFRPVQPINDRIIYSSSIDDATIWTAPLSPISITLAVLLGFIILFLVLGRQQRDGDSERLDYEYDHAADAHQD